MATHRAYTIEFKRQVAQEFLAGSTALTKRNDVCRNLIRPECKKTCRSLVERGRTQSAEPGPDAGGDRSPELCEANHLRADQHDSRERTRGGLANCAIGRPARFFRPPPTDRFSWRWAWSGDRSAIGCGSLAGSIGLRRHIRCSIARVHGSRDRCAAARGNRASFNLPAPGVAQALLAVPPIIIADGTVGFRAARNCL